MSIEKDFGLKAKEASGLLMDALKEEGFDKEDVGGFLGWVLDDIRYKVTIHEKDTFEKKLREVIRECKEQLRNQDYRDPHNKVLDLFRDKLKTKIRFIYRQK